MEEFGWRLKMKKNDGEIPLNECVKELSDTRIIQYIKKRNNDYFTKELVAWLVRYILVISSMNESLQLNLEDILHYFHGSKFDEILEITEQIFIKTSGRTIEEIGGKNSRT